MSTSRLKIEIPPIPVSYRCKMVVRVGDLNYGNHLGHDSLITLMHQARVRFLSEYNMSEMDIGGASLVVRDLQVIYQREAFLNDELLFEIMIPAPKASFFHVFYRVANQEKGFDVAKGRITMACLSLADKKLTKVPERFRSMPIFAQGGG